jgi:integrase
MPIVKLTQKFIENELQCPPGKPRIEYCDSDVRGLYVLVSKTSQGYYLRYKDQAGKTCHLKIGNTDDTTLYDAKNKAKKLKSEIAYDGRDPKAEEKAKQSVITYDEFFVRHYLPYVILCKRSWKRDEELFRLRIKDRFGPERLDQISRKKIQQFHTELLAEGLATATANHHLKLIRHSLNLAVEWEMLEKNPATRIHLLKEDNNVENYLNKEELERLLTILKTDDNRAVCHIALFLISTGARLNEGLRATWAQIDRENRVWRIPASNSKSKRIRAVPLNDSALDVLKQLDTEGEFDFLFINRRTGKPYTTIHRSWVRLKTKAGLPHLRLHDLRHQYASFLVNSGRTLYEVQQILGHSAPIVTQRYAHLSTKTLQEAANSASDMIKGASGSA